MKLYHSLLAIASEEFYNVTMRKTVSFCLLIICTVLCVYAQAEPPKVLLIHSYHPDFPWTEAIDRTITRRLRQDYPFISIDKEYYDTKRNRPEKMESIFLEYIKRKYLGHQFEVILCTDDNALRFLLKYRDELFPGVPCVFAGINNIDLYELDKEINITGVAEVSDFTSNIELIEKLFPEVETIAIISDSTPSAVSDLIELRSESSPFSTDLQFIELFNIPLEQLIDDLKSLPRKSAVLHISFWRDGNDRTFDPSVIIPVIVKAAAGPVFAIYDFTITDGTLGGIVVKSEQQGTWLAEAAIQILNGNPADSIPISRNKDVYPYFDYEIMRKYGISSYDIPLNSVILNKPDTLYHNSPGLFWFITSVIIVLSILVILLAFNFYFRKKNEKLFKTLFENIPDMIFVHDTRGRIFRTNMAAKIEQNLLLKTPEMLNPEFIKNNTPGKFESEIVLAGGSKYYEINSAGIELMGKTTLLSIFRDITTRKNTELQLKKSLTEKNTLLQEVHHRVKNNLQIISSLLNLQIPGITDPKALDALLKSQNRILAMATAHEQLYETTALSNIDLSEYITSLISILSDETVKDLKFSVDCCRESVTIDLAVTLGLILNELISNSIKYAFIMKNEKQISVNCIRLNPDEIKLTVDDNGRGFDFSSSRDSSLGLQLVDELTTQINAELTYSNAEGSEFTLIIPLPSNS